MQFPPSSYTDQVQRELGADKKDKDSIELEHSKVHEWHIVVPKKPSTTKLIKGKREWSVLEDTTKVLKVSYSNTLTSVITYFYIRLRQLS